MFNCAVRVPALTEKVFQWTITIKKARDQQAGNRQLLRIFPDSRSLVPGNYNNHLTVGRFVVCKFLQK